jgi:hypothetical protein
MEDRIKQVRIPLKVKDYNKMANGEEMLTVMVM